MHVYNRDMNTTKGHTTMNTHKITRDGTTHSEHASANDAFAALLRCQGQSVHHATTYEGWAVEPIERSHADHCNDVCGPNDCKGECATDASAPRENGTDDGLVATYRNGAQSMRVVFSDDGVTATMSSIAIDPSDELTEAAVAAGGSDFTFDGVDWKASIA